jgi:hypothetical protein
MTTIIVIVLIVWLVPLIACMVIYLRSSYLFKNKLKIESPWAEWYTVLWISSIPILNIWNIFYMDKVFEESHNCKFC